jgi:hypothetical protein
LLPVGFAEHVVGRLCGAIAVAQRIGAGLFPGGCLDRVDDHAAHVGAAEDDLVRAWRARYGASMLEIPLRDRGTWASTI